MFALAIFENNNLAYQVYLSFLFELKCCNYFENFLLIGESEFSKFKSLCSKMKLEYRLEKPYCLLPFPKHEKESKNYTFPRILITCLDAESISKEHQMWLDLETDLNDFYEDVLWFLSWSPAREQRIYENWEIVDFQNFNTIFPNHEKEEILSLLNQALIDRDETFYLFYQNFRFNKIIDGIIHFQELYRGEYESKEEFAKQYAIECGYIDENNPLYNHVNFEHYAKELEFSRSFYFLESEQSTFQVFANY